MENAPSELSISQFAVSCCQVEVYALAKARLRLMVRRSAVVASTLIVFLHVLHFKTFSRLSIEFCSNISDKATSLSGCMAWIGGLMRSRLSMFP